LNRYIHMLFRSLFLSVVILSSFISSGQQISLADIAFSLEQDDELDLPFAGGLRSPQFSTADLNLDGIEDIVIYDKDGRSIIPLIRAADRSLRFDPTFRAIFPDIPSWMLMRDYNGDGIKDIFCSPTTIGLPGVEIHKGVVRDGALTFELVRFPERDFDILFVPIGSTVTQIFASVIDIPDIKDLDGDGDLDILSFEPSGRTVYFYSNQALELGFTTDTLIYILEEICYGGVVESGFSQEVTLSTSAGTCASFLVSKDELVANTRHSGSTVLSVDVSGDSLPELLLGDISYDGLVMLDNTGTKEEAHFTDQEVRFPSLDNDPIDIELFISGYNEDMDGDGDKDLIIAPNDKFASQTTDHIWVYDIVDAGEEGKAINLVDKNFLIDDMIYHGPNSAPMFFDYNGDKLVDLLIGTCGLSPDGRALNPRLVLYRNAGTPTAPSYILEDDDYLGMSEFRTTSLHFAPSIGDVDGDGDLDLVIGDNNGRLYFIENQSGDPSILQFARPIYPAWDIKVSAWASPEVFDFNNDGLGDLILGELNFNSVNGKRSSFNYFQNQGTVGFATFDTDEFASPNNPRFGAIDLKEPGSFNNFSAPTIIDIGEELLFATGSALGNINLYTTDDDMPTDSFDVRSINYGDIREGDQSMLALADLNDDMFLEMAVGNRRGGVAIYNTDIRVDLGSSNIEVSATDLITIVPNPTADFLQLDIDASISRDGRIIIYNVDGRVISRHAIEDSVVDVSQLQSGTYFLEISTKDQSYTHRFIKVDP